jgi:hypothetical protein
LDQSWHLARKIADLRQTNASLQTMAAQYKQEMRQIQAQTQTHTPVVVAAHAEQPSVTSSTTTEEPVATAAPEPPPVEEDQPSSLMSDESSAPPQVAQAGSPTPDLTPVTPSVPSSPPAPVTAEPPEADESWFDMIIGWLLAFWNWLIS